MMIPIIAAPIQPNEHSLGSVAAYVLYFVYFVYFVGSDAS